MAATADGTNCDRELGCGIIETNLHCHPDTQTSGRIRVRGATGDLWIKACYSRSGR